MMQNEGIINLTAVDAPPSVEVTLPGIIGIIIKLVAHHASLASGTYHDIPSIPSFARPAGPSGDALLP
jgi:hypothetical protein